MTKELERQRKIRHKEVMRKWKTIIEKREQIIEAFIAETGLKPSEIELVEERRKDTIICYVRKRCQDK